MLWDSRDAMDDARQLPSEGSPVGFSTMFMSRAKANRVTNMSISRLFNNYEGYEWMRKEIERTTGKPFQIENPHNADPQVVPDASGWMLWHYNRLEGKWWEEVDKLKAGSPEMVTKLPTRNDMVNWIKQRAQELEGDAFKKSMRTTFGGDMGDFLAEMFTATVDPPVLATMLAGAGASAGVLRTALTEAGIALTTEAALQPMIQTQRAQLGVPYGFWQGAASVGAAGAGGFVFGGAVKIGGVGIKALIDQAKKIKFPSTEQRAATQTLADLTETLQDTPFNVMSDRSVGEYVSKTDHAMMSALMGVVPRLDELTPYRFRDNLLDHTSLNNMKQGLDFIDELGGLDTGQLARDIGAVVALVRERVYPRLRPLRNVLASQGSKGPGAAYVFDLRAGRIEELDIQGAGTYKTRLIEAARQAGVGLEDLSDLGGKFKKIKEIEGILNKRKIPLPKKKVTVDPIATVQDRATQNPEFLSAFVSPKNKNRMEVFLGSASDVHARAISGLLDEITDAAEAGIKDVRITIQGKHGVQRRTLSFDEAREIDALKDIDPDLKPDQSIKQPQKIDDAADTDQVSEALEQAQLDGSTSKLARDETLAARVAEFNVKEDEGAEEAVKYHSEQLRSVLEENPEQQMSVEVVQEDGTSAVVSRSMKDIMEDLDQDEKLWAEFSKCLGKATG